MARILANGRVTTQAFPLGIVANVWATQEAEGEHIATTFEKQCLLLLCVHAVKGVFRWYTSWQKVVGLLLNKREEKIRTSTGTTHRMTRHGWNTNQRSALYPTKLLSTFFAGNLNGNGDLERVIKTRGWALDGSELTTSTAAHPPKKNPCQASGMKRGYQVSFNPTIAGMIWFLYLYETSKDIQRIWM